MDEWKQAYESIPVPEELEFRVRSSIEQAKKAKKKENTITMKLNKIVKTTAATAAAALLTITVLANSSASIAQAMEQVPVLGAITRVFTFRTYEEDTGNTMARVDVPQVEGGSEELNAAIEEYTNAIIAEYQEAAKAVQGYDESGAPSAETNHYAVDLSYKVVTDTDKLFALRFDQTVVMASGNQTVKIYTVDKTTGQIIGLKDLFQADSDYLGVISENIKTQMRERMAKDDSLIYWIDSEMPELDFKSITDETAFFVNADGELTIVFNEGDAGPMFMGVCEFTVPTDVLADIALPGYLQ